MPRIGSRSSRIVLAVLLAAFLPACGGGSGSGPVHLVVTTDEDSGPGSLRQVLSDAPAGALVTFLPSLAGATIVLLTQLSVVRPVSIDGGVAGEEVTLDADDATRHFEAIGVDGFSLAHVNLTNGRAATNGGAVGLADTTARFERVRFDGNEADDLGGAVFAVSCDLTVVACMFSSNVAASGGGLAVHGGSSLVEHSSFLGNASVDGVGGGIRYDGGAHVLRSSTLHGNSASAGVVALANGGAVAAVGGVLSDSISFSLVGCTLTGNVADGVGGGLYAASAGVPSTADVRQSIVATNTAPAEPDVQSNGMMTVTSAWNVVGILAGGPIWHGLDGNQVGDPFSPLDPLLGGLVLDVFGILGRMPQPGSPAEDAVPPAENVDESGAPLASDVWYRSRTTDGAPDVGAVER